MKRNIHKLIIGSFVVLLFLIFFWFSRYYQIIDIGGKKIIVEVALDKEAQARGLGKREGLCQFCGMLFDFKQKDNYVFWMKDMQFDLDIFWINDDRIVHIEKNVPHTSLKRINPNIEADKVIEINAGKLENYGIKLGDKIRIYHFF